MPFGSGLYGGGLYGGSGGSGATLLSMCSQVASKIPVAAPTTIVGNPDETAMLLFACAQDEGDSLARYPQGGWIEMIREYDFTTAALPAQTGSVANTGPNGVAQITSLASTAGIQPLTWYAFGTGLMNNSIVMSVDSATQVTLNLPCATPTGIGAPAIFGQVSAAQLLEFGAGSLPTSAPGTGLQQLWNDGGIIAVDSFALPSTILPGTFLANNGGVLELVGAQNYPTSPEGLPPGAVWNDFGVVAVVPGGVSTSNGGIYNFGQSDYALPSDFERVIDNTLWDRSRFWSMRGPQSPQQWQLYKSSVIGRASIQRRFRFRNIGGVHVFSIDPVPTDNGSQLVFEYVSNAWCASSAGAPQTFWQADSDVPILDPYLFRLGIQWRILERLGLSYQSQQDECERQRSKAAAQNGGAAILDMTPNNYLTLIGPWNLPETNFGGPAT